MGDVAVDRQTPTVGEADLPDLPNHWELYYIDRHGIVTFVLKVIFSP
jgi:hypothetical protein